MGQADLMQALLKGQGGAGEPRLRCWRRGEQRLSPEVLQQPLVTLQLPPPTRRRQNQSIEIKPQLLSRQSLQQVEGGHLSTVDQQLLQGFQHLLTVDWFTSLEPDQLSEGLQQRTCCPAAQQLLPETAPGQHRCHQQTTQPLTAFAVQQLHPGREFRAGVV